jgi:membrane fusion protein, heavy metal efflux system
VYVKHFDLPYAFDRAPVVTGASNDRYTEIVRGLFPADEVVTTGAYSLGFAGGGSTLSLKEALDAAHGHEHAADGSELKPGGKNAAATSAQEGHAHDDHDHAQGAHDAHAHWYENVHLWQWVSAGLFVALLAVVLGRKTKAGN